MMHSLQINSPVSNHFDNQYDIRDKMLDIAPFFHLARIFGVIPFSRVNKYNISVSKCSLRLALFIQSLMALAYMTYSYQLYIEVLILFGSNDVRLTVTSVSGSVNYIIDQFNIWSIVFISQKLPALLTVILGNFAFTDRNLTRINWRWSKIRVRLLTFVTAAIIVVKNGLLIYQFDHLKLSVNIGARYIYGMILVLEQLISLLNLELNARFKAFHQEIKDKNGHNDLKDLRLLHDVYKALFENQSLIAQSFGKFLLFDLSQMFILIINGFLNVFLVCLSMKNGEVNSDFCVPAIFTFDCVWRFCFIARNCGSLQIEVR